MKILKIKYKKRGQLLERVMKVLIEDNLTTTEIHEEVDFQILQDLGISMYSWGIIESEAEND